MRALIYINISDEEWGGGGGGGPGVKKKQQKNNNKQNRNLERILVHIIVNDMVINEFFVVYCKYKN